MNIPEIVPFGKASLPVIRVGFIVSKSCGVRLSKNHPIRYTVEKLTGVFLESVLALPFCGEFFTSLALGLLFFLPELAQNYLGFLNLR